MNKSIKIDYSSIFFDDGVKNPQKRFLDRRKKLGSLCNGLVILFASETHFNEIQPWAYAEHPICQEPLFLFLTGINQRNLILIIDSRNNSYEEILFLPKKNPKKEFWDGLQFGSGNSDSVERAQQVTGLQNIENTSKFMDVLCQKLNQSVAPSSLSLYWHESVKNKPIKDELYIQKSRLLSRLKRKKISPEINNIQYIQWDLRLPLDEVDKQHLIAANKMLTKAFKTLVKEIPNLEKENQIHGVLQGELIKQTAYGNAFPSIIANGKNAATLHYTANNGILDRSSMVLLDFGVCNYSMHSDISRTIPVNGEYTPLQHLLYSIVLSTQHYVESLVRPGITIQELNSKCWDFLESQLDTLFVKKGGKMKRHYDVQPHFVSHLLGRQTHDGDPFRDYKNRPLQVGWALSNEPGLYGEFEININGRIYKEELGIRIEDDLIVTNDGCENLTTCPK
ncbi:M24 family metallopeptidase [bacterium]|jgi:Xaa-Pro aminopeptidase|nr:M24 family metallopeptidase [bacterium]